MYILAHLQDLTMKTSKLVPIKNVTLCHGIRLDCFVIASLVETSN